jgi:hypothetical protein
MLDPTVPLTVEGSLIVAQMQKLGIVVDVSGHTGVQTALDVIAMAEPPVVITHGNVQALNDNPRCSPDAVIEGVTRTGGLMGVAALSAFMTWGRKDAAKAETGPFPAQASLSRYVDEFDYLKKLVGVEHIALGTDFVTPGSGGGDPAQDFEYPPVICPRLMKSNCRWFRERLRPEESACRDAAPRLHGRGDCQDPGRQLDARLWASVEFLTFRCLEPQLRQAEYESDSVLLVVSGVSRF